MALSWYKAEWSTSMAVSTTVLFLVLVAAALFTLKAMEAPQPGIRVVVLLTEVVIFGTLLFAYLLSPIGYSLDGNNLTIARRLKPIVIPLSGINKTELSTGDLLAGSIRLLGNDGLWGCYGKFSNAGLGEYNLYIRSRKTLVLIESAGKYVIAPERPQEFLQNLQLAIAAAKDTGGAK